MEETIKGWVIINVGHPRTARKYIVSSSFEGTKRNCINKFIAESGSSWKHWRNKFNFRCVRAEQTIKTINNE